MREIFLFILGVCRFCLFFSAFLFGSSMFVCLFLLMATVNRRGRYYYYIYIIKDARCAICGFHHRFLISTVRVSF